MAFSPFPAGTIIAYGGSTAPTGWLLCDGTAVSRTLYAALFAAISGGWGTGDGSSTFNLPDLRGRFLRGVDGTANRDPNKATRTAANTGGNTGNTVGSVQANATGVNGLANAASSLTGATAANTNLAHTHASGTLANAPSSISGTAAAQVFTGVPHDHTGITDGATLQATPAGVDASLGSGLGQTASASHSHSFTTNTRTATGTNASSAVTGTAAAQVISGSTAAASVSMDHGHSVSGTAAAQTLSGDAETRPINANVNYIIKI